MGPAALSVDSTSRGEVRLAVCRHDEILRDHDGSGPWQTQIDRRLSGWNWKWTRRVCRRNRPHNSRQGLGNSRC